MLRTAVLGLENKEVIEAVTGAGMFDICAVADRELPLAERVSKAHDCAAFDDYRQMIMQVRPNVLVVAAPSHISREFMRTAIQEGINIVKLVPAGLDFESAADTVRLARKHKVRFFVADTCSVLPGFTKLAQYVKNQPAGEFNLLTSVCNFPSDIDDEENRWLSDPAIAGGGVLLRNCYGLLGLIISILGLPEKVYSLNTNHAPDRKQRLSITEDTAVVAMKFSDTLLGNFVASRTFGLPDQYVRLHSMKEVVTARPGSFSIRDNFGKVIEKTFYDVCEKELLKETFKKFGQSLFNPDQIPFAKAEQADINTMSVIESAYLSAKTAMPEEPGRLLDIVKS